jgi:hypothetical protein
VPGVVVNAYNPNTQKAVEERSPVPGQPGLHSETLSEIMTNKKTKLKPKSCNMEG